MDYETLRHLSYALDNRSPEVRLAVLNAIQAWVDAQRREEKKRGELKDARRLVYDGLRADLLT